MTTSTSKSEAPAAAITTVEHRQLLDIIDNLRAQGLGRYVDLPEIIVCGDQSAGKSSVLEAISGLRFPTKDGLCTRFATELVLRRGERHATQVSIIPARSREHDERDGLKSWKPFANIDIDGLDAITTEALDELRASGHQNFYDDVLRIELTGPSHPHLTMVDLPGLFETGDDRGQSDADANTVCAMVTRYMDRPRSIILAVVSAKNEYVLQKVTKMAKRADPEGQRTLGLVTKPDTLDAGSDSEAKWVRCVQNKENHLKLGWHVLRNRNYRERHSTAAERDAVELEFLSSGVWAAVDHLHCGVDSLKIKLSSVLKDQIISQLPDLLGDVEKEIKHCTEELDRLGPERQGRDKQLRYLLELGEKYTALMRHSVDGTYTDPFFGNMRKEASYSKRLRAVVRNSLSDFTTEMRQNGHHQLIVDEDTGPVDDQITGNSLWITRSDYVTDVAAKMRMTRGRELPGLFNPLIVGELFTEQCEPWHDLAHGLIDEIVGVVHETARQVLEHIAAQSVWAELSGFIQRQIDELETNLKSKVDELLTSATQNAITENRRLIEIVERSQRARHKRAIKQQFAQIFGLGEIDNTKRTFNINLSHVVDLLAEGPGTDMESFGSSWAVDYMQAYYEVARDRFIDDLSVLAVEDCLIKNLTGLFRSEMVCDLGNEDLARLAGETEACAAERRRLEEKRGVLKAGLRSLKSLQKHQGHTTRLASRVHGSLYAGSDEHEGSPRNIPRSNSVASLFTPSSHGDMDDEVLSLGARLSGSVTTGTRG